MLDLFRVLVDPKAGNAPAPSWLRWPLATILAVGFGFCVVLGVDTIKHWSERPNPGYWIAFVGVVGTGAGLLAVKLFRGDQIVEPVRVPPRPIVVRLLGLVTLLVCGPIALTSLDWYLRIEFGIMALGGLTLLVAPTLLFPASRQHGA